MANKFKHYVRLDSNLQPVLGSNIARRKKPVSGKWLQIFPPNCCNDELRHVPADVTTATGFDFYLYCDGTNILAVRVMGATANIDDVATLLSGSLAAILSFSVDGTALVATIDVTKFSALCGGQMSFEVSAL